MAERLDDGQERERPYVFARLTDYRACSTPFLDRGVDGTSRRFATCRTIKRLEKVGKSSLIDSFTVTHGLPLGAHRAYDKMHDPLLGFGYAVREMGWPEALAKWPRHMASDVLTARSLPLPFTHLMKCDSWVVRMYARGIVNMRTAVVTPVIGVAITEAAVRARTRRAGGEIDKDKLLQDEHMASAAISALSAISLGLMPNPPVAVVFALSAAGAWSAAAGIIYLTKRHQAEIASAARATRRKVAAGTAASAAAVTRIAAKQRSTEDEPEGTEMASVPRITPTSGDRLALGVAALAAVLILATARG